MATTPGHYLHLVAWAQIGVIIRVYLGLIFGSACSPNEPWVPCVTSNGVSRHGGAAFSDLPANIVGSFLMGLFVSSDVLSNSLKHTLTVEAPMAMLPTWSPLQTHLPFQVGLRTGLCGSLTTFASWNLQMVIMLVGGQPMAAVGGSDWVAALSGLLVGCLCALAALVMGQHVALLMYHQLNPGAFIPYGSPAPEQQQLEEEIPALPTHSDSLARTPSRVVTRTLSSFTRGRTTIVMVDAEANAQPYLAAEGSRANSGTAAAGLTPSLELTTAGAGSYSQARRPSLTSQVGSFSRRGSGRQPLDAESDADAVTEVSTEVDDKASSMALTSVLLADGFAAVTICILTAISIWRIVGSNQGRYKDAEEPFAAEWIWWSVLLGPVGCYLRYYLSRYNGALHGSWKWFPVGTFTANIGACVLDYVVRAVELRVALSSLQVAVLGGVMSGVGGCLSTVSTWVVEIQRLLLSFPNSSHGYSYIFISLSTSVILGLVIYGIPVWTL